MKWLKTQKVQINIKNLRKNFNISECIEGHCFLIFLYTNKKVLNLQKLLLKKKIKYSLTKSIFFK